MIEIWKVIKKFPKYRISNKGRIQHIQSCRYRKIRIDSVGYYSVSLCDSNSPVKLVTNRVHVLLADTFLHKPITSECVNHKDGIKTNNSLYNLEWTTHKENTRHAVKIGLFPNGDRNGHSKLSHIDVEGIRFLSTRYRNCELARYFEVSRQTICDILKNRTWNNSENGLEYINKEEKK